MVTYRRRWYLLARDPGRQAWRTFRVDRVVPLPPAGPRFTSRPLPPGEEIAAHLARGIGEATWRHRARVVVHAPADHVRDRIPVPADVRPLGADRCTFEPGSDRPELLALCLGMLGVDFTVVDPPEPLEALRDLAARFARAVESGTGTDR